MQKFARDNLQKLFGLNPRGGMFGQTGGNFSSVMATRKTRRKQRSSSEAQYDADRFEPLRRIAASEVCDKLLGELTVIITESDYAARRAAVSEAGDKKLRSIKSRLRARFRDSDLVGSDPRNVWVRSAVDIAYEELEQRALYGQLAAIEGAWDKLQLELALTLL